MAGQAIGGGNVVIRRAQQSDWDDIMDIYAAARQFMRDAGNPDQWGDSFPPEELVREDIRLGRSCVCLRDGRIQGVFAFLPGEDPTYRVIDGAWLDNRPYCAVHRVASRGETPGVAGEILAWCLEQCPSIRIDTHEKNRPMQRALEKAGFIPCGVIVCDDGTPRIAFHKSLPG